MSKKTKQKLTTVTVDRETFEMLEKIKFLTFSTSYNTMFEKLLPAMQAAALKYFADIGDTLFSDKMKHNNVDITSRLGVNPATE